MAIARAALVKSDGSMMRLAPEELTESAACKKRLLDQGKAVLHHQPDVTSYLAEAHLELCSVRRRGVEARAERVRLRRT